MRKLIALVSVVVVLSLPSGAQQQARPVSVKTASQAKESAPETQASDLPVRRVVLYKNGVGYFEHIGRVRGNENIHIDFTSGQLNDALASLTVLDLDGGRISGVSYNSTDPLDKRLGALRLPLDEQTSVSKFLDALRGSRLEVSSGADPVTGRLLSVERKTRTAGGTTLEVDIISVVTDGGEIREVEVTPSTRVRLVDTGLHGEMNRYLSLLASEREQDLRRMTVATTGTGDRQLFVSYISEVPVWKTTYRLVLSSETGKKPLLQGWAIVDNTVGEDWDNVNLSLVADSHGAYLGAVFWSVSRGLPAGVSALIASLQPILTAALARPLLGETVSAKRWCGIAAAALARFSVISPKLGLAGEEAIRPCRQRSAGSGQ